MYIQENVYPGVHFEGLSEYHDCNLNVLYACNCLGQASSPGAGAVCQVYTIIKLNTTRKPYSAHIIFLDTEYHNFNLRCQLSRVTQITKGHNLKLRRVTNCATIACVYNSTVKLIDHIHAEGSHGVQLRECLNTTESPHSVHM